MNLFKGDAVYHFAFGQGEVLNIDEKSITVDFPKYEIKRTYTKKAIDNIVFSIKDEEKFIWYYKKQEGLQNVDILKLCLKDAKKYSYIFIAKMYFNYACNLSIKNPEGALIRDIIYMLSYTYDFSINDAMGEIYREMIAYNSKTVNRNVLRSACEIGHIFYFDLAAYELMKEEVSELKNIIGALNNYNPTNDDLKRVCNYYRNKFEVERVSYITYLKRKRIDQLNKQRIEEENKEKEEQEANKLIEWFKVREENFSICKENIRGTLENRNISTLVHFTDASNLESILKYGIVPRVLHDAENIKANYSDANYLTRTSLSIEFPNYMMLKRKINSRSTDYVIILIDATVLLDNNVLLDKRIYDIGGPERSDPPYLFYKENASRGDPVRVGSLDEMFPDSIKPKYSNNILSREMLEIPSNYTTSPQAEITTLSTIPVSYIKAIIFNNVELKEKLLSDCDKIPTNVDLLVADDSDNDYGRYFSDRCDAKIWREMGGYYC